VNFGLHNGQKLQLSNKRIKIAQYQKQIQDVREITGDPNERFAFSKRLSQQKTKRPTGVNFKQLKASTGMNKTTSNYNIAKRDEDDLRLEG